MFCGGSCRRNNNGPVRPERLGRGDPAVLFRDVITHIIMTILSGVPASISKSGRLATRYLMSFAFPPEAVPVQQRVLIGD